MHHRTRLEWPLGRALLPLALGRALLPLALGRALLPLALGRPLLLLLALGARSIGPATGTAVATGRLADEAVGIRLLNAPTSRSGDPRAHLYIIDHVHPGTTLTRRVELTNATGQPELVALYAAGADIQRGQFRFLDGHDLNELAGWTSVQPDHVQLPPGGSALATVTISVPGSASAGERYAVVWAELPRRSATGGGVAAVNRVGIRIYLSVGPGGEPVSDFMIESLSAQRTLDGRPMVVARVRNTGSRAVDLSGELRLTAGPGGLSAGPYAVQHGTTLGLGQAEPVLVPVDPAIPAGPWRATLMLRSGLVQRTASATIIFPDTPGSATAAVPATTSRAAGWRTLLAGGGFVLLSVWIYRLWRGRRRRRHSRDLGQSAGVQAHVQAPR
jgi:hypothetical protein